MRRTRCTFIATISCITLLCPSTKALATPTSAPTSAPTSQPASRPTPLAAPSANAVKVTVPRAQSVPRIDGDLRDAAWRDAVRLPAFTARSPNHGGAARETTEVYLLYQPDALYVAVRLDDGSPKKIVAALGARDAPPNSDRVTLYLDPLLTRRRGYYFGVTAAGIQLDGLFYDDQNEVSTWDAAWSSATRRNLGEAGSKVSF